MANRVTGLSGMDIEGMVSNLMKVETQKADKLYREKQLIQWKQEAYLKMSSALSTFQSKFFSFTNPLTNMKSTSLFMSKNFSIKDSNGADSNAVTVKNTALSKNVEYKLKVHQLAQKQKMTGTPSNDGNYAKKIISGEIDVNKLQEEVANGMSNGLTLSLNLDGKTVTASLDKDFIMNLNGTESENLSAIATELNSQFAEFGKAVDSSGNTTANNKVRVSAANGSLSFETQAGRTLRVSSFSNGYTASASFAYDSEKIEDELSFTIKGSDGASEAISVETFKMVKETDEDGNETGNENKVYLTAAELAEKINEAINDKGINKDTDGNYVKNLAVSASGNNIKFEAASTTVSYSIQETTQDTTEGKSKLTAGDEINIYGKKTSELGVASGASTDNTAAMTVGSVFGIQAGDTDKLDSMKINGKSFSELGIDETTTISQLTSKINSANLGVTLSYSPVAGTFTMEGTKTGAANAFTLSQDAMDAFGFSSSSATILEAKDAVFEIDGIMTTRESNDVAIGDLTATLEKVTPDEITIKSQTDTEGIMNTIKEFVKSYNEILTSFTTAYSETRSKNGTYTYYEPLTDEERSAMSDKDIELWEERAKQGILSRDGTVGRVIDSLRNAVNMPVTTSSGGKISLSQLGIASTDWKDMGVLSIDEDKLKKAIESRPEDIADLFSKMSSESYNGNRQKRNAENGLAYRIDDIIQDATRTTPHPKTGTYGYFVELAGSKTAKAAQNAMTLKLDEITQKIYDLEILNLSKENRYYDMFSKMEQAMTKSQNQMSMAGLG